MLRIIPRVCFCEEPDCIDCRYTKELSKEMSKEIELAIDGKSDWLTLDEILNNYILKDEKATEITRKIIKLTLQGNDTSKETEMLKDYLRKIISDSCDIYEFEEWAEQFY